MYKTETPKKSQSSMPREKHGSGSTQNNETYGSNQRESEDAGVSDKGGLNNGREHGETGTIDGTTSGKPSGRPEGLFKD